MRTSICNQMAADLYYGIHLTEEEFRINCGNDFVVHSQTIKTMSDWSLICNIFYSIQVKYGIDFNIIQYILRIFINNTQFDIHVPEGKVYESGESGSLIPIDTHGYSAYYENGYTVKYPFCRFITVDFEYSNTTSDCDNTYDYAYKYVLGVQLMETKYHYDGKISFSIDDLNAPCVAKFNDAITNHPNLCKFNPRFFMIGSTCK